MPVIWRIGRVSKAAGVAFAISIPLLIVAAPAQAWTYKTLYSFKVGTDGSRPTGLIRDDAAGDLYGTTQSGGKHDKGTVYKLSADGSETVLYSFTGKADGGHPWGPLIRDQAGNLYGTAVDGGDLNCLADGCGTVFKLSPAGRYTVLHTFEAADGFEPMVRLMRDAATGDLYGTTHSGGPTGEAQEGTVFKLATDGTFSVLHAFGGGFQHNGDGSEPDAAVIMDGSGNLLGTTVHGGKTLCTYGCGIIYQVIPDGQETVLHSFTVKRQAYPLSALTRDTAGNLYGSASGNCRHGAVFKMAAGGAFKLLYTFSGKQGSGPVGDLVVDGAGTIYGAATGCGFITTGIVFELDPNGKEMVLHDFGYEVEPLGGVIADTKGNLYGVTYYGGDSEAGMVYELVKD